MATREQDLEWATERTPAEIVAAVMELLDRGVDEVRTAQRVNCRFGVYYSPAEVMAIWRAAVQKRQPGLKTNSDGSAYHSRCSERVGA